MFRVMAVEVVAEYLSSIDSLRVNVFFTQTSACDSLSDPPAALPLLSVNGEEDFPEAEAATDALSTGVGGQGPIVKGDTAGDKLVLRVGTRANKDRYGGCKLALHLDQHQIFPREGYVELKGRVSRRRQRGTNQQHPSGSPMRSTDLVDQRLLLEEQSLRQFLEGSGHGKGRGTAMGTLRCSKCNAALSRFSRVERLPHPSWVESAAQWFCACSGTENALHYLEQVEDSLQPTSGVCLLGETVCIVGARDILSGCELETTNTTATPAEGEREREKGVKGVATASTSPAPGAYRCHECKTEVGIFGPWQSTHGASKGSNQEQSFALTLFKYAVRVGVGEEEEDCFKAYTPCTSFAQDLQMACQASQQMKYQVSVLGDTNSSSTEGSNNNNTPGIVHVMQLVILNQKVVLGHVHLDGDGDGQGGSRKEWTGLSMKVLHKTISESEGEGGGWAKAKAASCITVPLDVGLDLIHQLETSTTELLPKSCSSYDNFSIGYLKLVQSCDHPLFQH